MIRVEFNETNPVILPQIHYDSRSETASRIYAGAGERYLKIIVSTVAAVRRSTVSYPAEMTSSNGQTDGERRRPFDVLPSRVADAVDDEQEQESQDYLHQESLHVRQFVTQVRDAQVAFFTFRNHQLKNELVKEEEEDEEAKNAVEPFTELKARLTDFLRPRGRSVHIGCSKCST